MTESVTCFTLDLSVCSRNLDEQADDSGALKSRTFVLVSSALHLHVLRILGKSNSL